MLLHCDRCHRKVEGDESPYFTSGFYYVDRGYWAKYARPCEVVVCDECIWADPGYIADYGQRA